MNNTTTVADSYSHTPISLQIYTPLSLQTYTPLSLQTYKPTSRELHALKHTEKLLVIELIVVPWAKDFICYEKPPSLSDCIISLLSTQNQWRDNLVRCVTTRYEFESPDPRTGSALRFGGPRNFQILRGGMWQTKNLVKKHKGEMFVKTGGKEWGDRTI